MGKRGGYMGGMPGNMNNLMKQAQRMQRQMEEQQKILCEAGDEAGLFQNQKQDEMLADYVAKMEAAGVEIIELDAAEKQKFVDAAAGIYSDPDVTGAWRDGLYDMIREVIA